jgi:hypothetical protein
MSSQRGTGKRTTAKGATAKRTAGRGTAGRTTGRRSKVVEEPQGNSPWLWSNFLGLMPTVILAIVFALPLKTVPVQATETYWDTEMRSEPYTVAESYTETEPYVTTESRTVNEPYAYPNPIGWWQMFGTGADVSIDCPYYPYGPSPYYQYPCTVCSYADNQSTCRLWQPYYYQSRPRTITEEVTKYRTVTKTRDVIKYRDVPTQVLKERPVTQYVRMSIWAYLFS